MTSFTAAARIASTISWTGHPIEECVSVELPQIDGLSFRFLGILGSGAFGQVFHAMEEGLRRHVALKVFHARGSLEACAREGRIAAHLCDNSIPFVYISGSTADGRWFIGSEFIEGSDLARLLAVERLPYYESVMIVATIADVLHYAHGSGVIHRDVKPSNILIDRSGKPYLTDFGIALSAQYASDTEVIAGTLPYMSPEQATGLPLDHRTDVWSLGVVLQELLTGRRPFVAPSREELRAMILDEPHLKARAIDTSIPSALEEVCDCCLAKDRSLRFTDAAELSQSLRTIAGSLA